MVLNGQCKIGGLTVNVKTVKVNKVTIRANWEATRANTSAVEVNKHVLKAKVKRLESMWAWLE